MRARAYAPAGLAVLGVVVIYLVATRGHDTEPTAAPPPAETHAAETHAAASPVAAPAPAPALPGQQATKPVPHVLTPEEYKGHEPGKTKKPAMTLEDRLAETTKHVAVMEKRATLLEQEIADLEKAGKTKEAAEQKIVLKRLREHAEKLRQAVAEGRDPQQANDVEPTDPDQ